MDLKTGRLMISSLLGAWVLAGSLSAHAQPAGAYAAAQADRGKTVYTENCAMCHGDHLDDGSFGPSVKGPAFLQDWGGKSADGLLAYLQAQMPPSNAGSLPQASYLDVLAFMLQANGVAPGPSELTADAKALKGLTLPK